MKEIKNIVFDFGGVLLDWNPRYVYSNYFGSKDEMEYFLANICTGEWNAEHDRGRSFDEGVSLLQAQYPECAEAIAMFRDKWKYMIKGEIHAGVSLLRKLKAARYKIYGLTNWSAETIDYALSKYDFFKLFDGIVVSGREKIIKPDAGIYKILLERYGLNAAESVFIDDSLPNINAARELGFNAILFDNIENVLLQLKSLNVINNS